jgi:diacylglycerol kinase family enzyme
MNAQWLGDWDLGLKAHPGDGLLDVTDANLPLSDRLRARRRLPLGTHVPHRAISTARVEVWQTDLTPSLDVFLDGEKVARVGHLSVRVEPDALHVVV